MNSSHLTRLLQAHIADHRHVAIAFSGGRDSVALLHAVAQWAHDRSRTQPEKAVTVHALHIHHGLQFRADEWVTFGATLVSEWQQAGWPIQFHHHRLTHQPARGESVEAWARQQRYQALAQMAQQVKASIIMMAHHRRDQAETFILQALRGSGVMGWSAMPTQASRHHIQWVRPWLEVTREDIEAYLQTHQLPYVDDPSNLDIIYARNRLRHQVWPALEQAFPQAEVTLARAAKWAQEAALNLRDLATLDLQSLQLVNPDQLPIAAWRQLAEARRHNALRHWLFDRMGQWPDAKAMDRTQVEICTDHPDDVHPKQWPCGPGILGRYRGYLSWTPRHATGRVESERESSTPPPVQLEISGPGTYVLEGWGGSLHIAPADLSETHNIPAKPVTVIARARQGGEEFSLGPGRPARALKKQYQSLGVPQWLRHAPLLWVNHQLMFVPGLGVEAAFQPATSPAHEGQRWAISWSFTSTP